MPNPKTILQLSGAAAVLAVGACSCALLLSLRATAVCVPKMLAGFQNAALERVDRLQETINALPGQVVPPVVAAAQAEVRHGVDLTGDKVDAVLTETAAWRQTLDGRLADVAGKLDARSGEALTEITNIRGDLRPVLTNTATLVSTYSALPDRLAYANRWL